MHEMGVKTTFVFIGGNGITTENRKFWYEVICVITMRFIVQRLNIEFLNLRERKLCLKLFRHVV